MTLAPDLTGPSPLYVEFYGLVEPPFSLNPDPRFYFESRAHRAALDLVFGTFGPAESAVIIAGDIGAGKTMLCGVALEQIPPRMFLAVVPSLLVDRAAFFAQILEQFGILSADWRTFPEPSADELVATLEQFLSTLPLLQAHAVIMVDDAQQIRPELLDEIRLLTNTGAESSRRLRIVLLGEPALLELLVGSSQPLLARTSDARVLSPLAGDEIEPYIKRRLWIARGSPIPDTPGGPGGVLFGRDSVAAVGACSGGLPGTINALCHRVLEDAAARAVHVVDRATVVAAAQHLGMPVPIATRLRPYRDVALAAVVVLAAAVTWMMTGGTFRAPWANRSGGPQTSGSRDEVRQVARKDANGGPTAPGAATSALPAPTLAEAPVVNATLQRSESFTVLVASFRTLSRARAATDAATALGLPSFMRTIQDGWQSVVVGPYASRLEAEEARNSLELAHFAGTRVISTPSTDPEPGASPSSAIVLAALLPVPGRSTVVIDLAAEPGGATMKATDNRSADVEIGPLPGRIDDQNLVPAGAGILERISVRSVAQGETATAHLSVATREPTVATLRRVGRRVYVDLTYPIEPAAAALDAEPEASAPAGRPVER